MPDFPAGIFPGDHHIFGIGTLTGCSLTPGITNIGPAATAWPSANLAMFVPFRLPVPATVFQMACGTGTATTGNFDLGIYDPGGNRLVSTGTTAKTTASSERIVNVTDTFLGPGMYYLAMSVDGTGAYQAIAPSSAQFMPMIGMRQAASAFVLPATVTYATVTNAVVPVLSAWFRAD